MAARWRKIQKLSPQNANAHDCGNPAAELKSNVGPPVSSVPSVLLSCTILGGSSPLLGENAHNCESPVPVNSGHPEMPPIELTVSVGMATLPRFARPTEMSTSR